MFSIAGKEYGPGEKAYEELRVSTLSTGMELSIPYVVVTGRRPGPILYVGAGSHGDEVTSMLVASDLARKIEPDDLKKGAMIIVPLHNPPARLRKKRWGLIDNLDMNRVWPGDPDGTVSEMLAHHIFQNLVLSSDYLLDLHTAAGDGENAPHAITPPPELFNPRKKRYAARRDESMRLAEWFGTPFVASSRVPEEPRKKYYSFIYGELHVAAAMNGIPAIVVELGEGARLNPSNYKLGLSGVINVARHLGIMKGRRRHPGKQVLIKDYKAIRASKGGIAIVEKKPGEHVNEGEETAILVTHKEEIPLRSPISGYVMRVRRYPVVEPGERIVVIGSENSLNPSKQ